MGIHVFYKCDTCDFKCDTYQEADLHEQKEASNGHLVNYASERKENKPVTVEEKVEDKEKLYLVCHECGEAFDTIEIAYAHAEKRPGCRVLFGIMTESEAM